MTTLRFGVVGLVHDHVWPVWGPGYINELQALDTATIVAAADKHPHLLERIRREHGVEKTYSDYREMIENEKLDAILMALPNDEKAEPTEFIADHRLHILMDKPMAANVQQADLMLQAADRNGIKLLVNWPSAWRRSLHKGYELLQQGIIGDLHSVKARTANPGPEYHGCSDFFLEWLFDMKKNGGGALVDYACYGINFTLWYMGGKPNSVVASGGHYVKDNIPAVMEDNAVVLMEYDQGLGISEASWTQFGSTNDSVQPLCLPVRVQRSHAGSTDGTRHRRRFRRIPEGDDL